MGHSDAEAVGARSSAAKLAGEDAKVDVNTLFDIIKSNQIKSNQLK